MKIRDLLERVEQTINPTSEIGLAIGTITEHAAHYYRVAESALARLEVVYRAIGNDRDAELVRGHLDQLRNLAEVPD